MTSKCPICAKSVSATYRPFCSRRCADIDLQRWLVGRYAIPAARDDDDDDDEIRPPSPSEADGSR